VATARGAIQDTRPAGDTRQQRGPDDSDLHADRNDPDAEDHSLGGAQLLQRELGASIIEEIQHD
jgi:DNA polymerase-3 subunit gamma/tau